MMRFVLLLVACTSANPDFDGTREPANEFPTVEASPNPAIAIGAPCDPDGPACAGELACCETQIGEHHDKRRLCMPLGWCSDDDGEHDKEGDKDK